MEGSSKHTDKVLQEKQFVDNQESKISTSATKEIQDAPKFDLDGSKILVQEQAQSDQTKKRSEKTDIKNDLSKVPVSPSQEFQGHESKQNLKRALSEIAGNLEEIVKKQRSRYPIKKRRYSKKSKSSRATTENSNNCSCPLSVIPEDSSSFEQDSTERVPLEKISERSSDLCNAGEVSYIGEGSNTIQPSPNAESLIDHMVKVAISEGLEMPVELSVKIEERKKKPVVSRNRSCCTCTCMRHILKCCWPTR